MRLTSRRERIADFEAWLHERGNASELALFNRSVVDGMLSLTGGESLQPEHIERAAALARDAGMDTPVAALGALLVEFETAPAEGAPPLAEVAPPLAEVAPVLAEPAPFGITLKLAKVAEAEPAPVAEPEPVTARSSRGWVGYAAGVAVVAALVVVGVRLRGHRAERASTPTAAAEARVRLRRVPLSASVPRGWREARDSELLPAGEHAPPTSLVFRDGTAADPDRGVFVAVLPAAGELAGQPADAALISAASTAERGLGAAVAHGAGRYVSAGCTVVTLGGVRSGTCVGTVETAAKAEVATYVRVVGDREIVAVSVTRRPSPAASAENAALVASLAP